jgi:GNAT superfamily N-acetyltransferase
MANVIIREATPDDAEAILGFIRGLAEFENEPPETVRTTEADIRTHGFGPDRHFETLIAERDGRPIGMALFFSHYSTWEGRPALYLEDLYVEPEHRGTGAGFALMRALARIADERDWTRLDLSVLDWNPAREFYSALGMQHESEWLLYRLEGQGISDLASAGEQD